MEQDTPQIVEGRLFIKRYFYKWDGPYNTVYFETSDGKEYPVANEGFPEALYYEKKVKGVIFINNNVEHVLITKQ